EAIAQKRKANGKRRPALMTTSLRIRAVTKHGITEPNELAPPSLAATAIIPPSVTLRQTLALISLAESQPLRPQTPSRPAPNSHSTWHSTWFDRDRFAYNG